MATDALVCRTLDGKHELWGLTATKDGFRCHQYMGTVDDPSGFLNRVILDAAEDPPVGQ
jgi:hypothetical protein